MSVGGVVGLAVLEGLFGLVILAILWPTRRSGVRLLGRWGVADPSEAELAEALTYLRRRRFWYPWLFLGLLVAFFEAWSQLRIGRSFVGSVYNLQAMGPMVKDALVADAVAIVSSIDPIMGEVDR